MSKIQEANYRPGDTVVIYGNPVKNTGYIGKAELIHCYDITGRVEYWAVRWPDGSETMQHIGHKEATV